MNTIGRLDEITPQTLSQITKLDHDFFPHPWSAEQWLQLDSKNHLIFVSSAEADAIGFALFALVPGDETAHLLKICLAIDHRGKLYASELWQFLAKKLIELKVRSIYLEVDVSNTRAIGFYKKQGFLTLRVLKSFYSNGGDALTMTLTL